MRRMTWMVLSLLPGAAAVLKGRYLLGALLMGCGLVGADLAWMALGGMLETPQAVLLGWFAATVSASAVLGSVFWTARATSPQRLAERENRAGTAFVAACESLLKGELSDAELRVAAGLKVAREDFDLAFLSWQIARAGGDARQARRRLRRLRRFDADDKWLWETERAIRRDQQ
ncbi:MAG: hypothetical protein ACKVX7_11025 [Planctomycetota bacterium]